MFNQCSLFKGNECKITPTGQGDDGLRKLPAYNFGSINFL
jgi:hypothetical protein